MRFFRCASPTSTKRSKYLLLLSIFDSHSGRKYGNQTTVSIVSSSFQKLTFGNNFFLNLKKQRPIQGVTGVTSHSLNIFLKMQSLLWQKFFKLGVSKLKFDVKCKSIPSNFECFYKQEVPSVMLMQLHFSQCSQFRVYSRPILPATIILFSLLNYLKTSIFLTFCSDFALLQVLQCYFLALLRFFVYYRDNSTAPIKILKMSAFWNVLIC